MTQRDFEQKRLKKAALKAKCRYVCPWKVATVIFLALMLALGPMSLAVQACDNVAATRFGGALWKLKNPDENAVFQTEQKPPLEMEDQAYRQLQHEAIVLLKNENGALPLQQTAVDCWAGSLVRPQRAIDLKHALSQEGVEVGNGTVIVLLTRSEQTLLQELSQQKAAGEIEKIILLWDTDKPVQPDVWKDCDADAVLWTGGGEVSGIAAVLVGAAPSGALPHTGAYGEYPAPTGSVYTGYKYYETRYEDYVMGTEKVGDFVYSDAVAYPFGFGLRYTTFAYSDLQVVYDAQTDNFAVTVTVTNTGSAVSRHILQIYAQSPYTAYDRENGVEKPAVKLVGFAKTGLLSAGESVTLTVQVARRELASYDAKGAGTYILDIGDYYLTVAANAHNAVNNILAAKGYTVESTAGRMDADGDVALTYKWNQSNFDDQSYRGAVNRFVASQTGVSRKDWEGTLSQTSATPEQSAIQYTPGDYATVAMPTLGAKNGLKLYDMKGLDFDDPLWQTLLDQLTFGEMAKLIGDAYRQTAPLASVQAPGTFVADLNMPTDEVFLSAAFDENLMYAIGWWAGENAIARGETALRCFDGSFEDSFLTGALRARQASGIAGSGVNVLLYGNETMWRTEQAAREQYLRAFQDTAQLLPTTGIALNRPAKELTEILRQEWGIGGMAVTADTPAVDGLFAGITVFDGQSADAQKELAAYENDPVIVSAMRQACHYNLYALVNSAAMNGIGENTVVKPQLLYVVTLLRVLMGLCAAAAVVFGILWHRGKAKWQQTAAYLDYQAVKNPPQEEETE